MSVFLLENTVQPYDWGSVDSMPEILGFENPRSEPMAELWMGAHPKAPSRIADDGRTLIDAVAADPDSLLGPGVARRFDGALPFLFKVLAAERALSIQAHPSLDQARRGYLRENEAGIPLDASHRNYRDANHKPEIICPLTEYWALCGFREPDEIRSLLAPVDASPVRDALEALATRGLEGLLTTLLSLGADERAGAVLALIDAMPRDRNDVGRWVHELNRQFPGDIGVFAPTFLNLLRLDPGEAVYLPAGILHAYLHGTGIELMANSDNVLRGGLTRKHIDIPELTSTLRFEPYRPGIIRPDSDHGWDIFSTPAAEFELSRAVLDGGEVDASGDAPSIVLCVRGGCTVNDAGTTLEVSRGHAVFVSHSKAPVMFSGSCTLYRASVPSGEGGDRG